MFLYVIYICNLYVIYACKVCVCVCGGGGGGGGSVFVSLVSDECDPIVFAGLLVRCTTVRYV